MPAEFARSWSLICKLLWQHSILKAYKGSLTAIGLETLKLIMAVALFGLGVMAVIAGLFTILAREYQDTLRQISAQSARISAKSVTDASVSATIDSAARLIEAVSKLVQTAAGVGAFLSLFGVSLCVISYLILTTIL